MIRAGAFEVHLGVFAEGYPPHLSGTGRVAFRATARGAFEKLGGSFKEWNHRTRAFRSMAGHSLAVRSRSVEIRAAEHEHAASECDGEKDHDRGDATQNGVKRLIL